MVAICGACTILRSYGQGSCQSDRDNQNPKWSIPKISTSADTKCKAHEEYATPKGLSWAFQKVDHVKDDQRCKHCVTTDGPPIKGIRCK